ncbi:LysR family transcriptional regulator [Rhizobium pusense]|uniref:LysR family transcriptional regulator n=1 Tax=Agrobacterium pusense TaxID=648995 RepID=UPI00244D5434|nr:LysR family transcriptional regulator [Agrobacterium pusense]MDH2091627.1 LysR family transcriptional regulator [Agrobacterium pusense]
MRHFDTIDFRLLRVYLVLVESGSFSAAQIALNISQSTLSTHLAALERKLGGSLCVRGRGTLTLTPLGRRTYDAAVQLFADVHVFQQRVNMDEEQLVGRIRVGIVDGVVGNPHLGLQKAIGAFVALAGGVFIELSTASPNELEIGLTEGKLDVGIGTLSQKAPRLTYLPFYREPHSLYCGKGHPLFEATDMTQESLDKALFSVRNYDHLEDLYRVNHPRASGSINHTEAQVMMILSGAFIGFLPQHIGDEWRAKGMVKAIKPSIHDFQCQHVVGFDESGANIGVVRPFLRELLRHSGSASAVGPQV